MNWIGLWTLIRREVGRFFSVYRQTVLPGLISSALYILVFGFTLEQRISEIQGVSYTWFSAGYLSNMYFKWITNKPRYKNDHGGDLSFDANLGPYIFTDAEKGELKQQSFW